jgi:hypothetical protein
LLEYKDFYPSTISHPRPQLRFGYIHHVLNKNRDENAEFHPALDRMLVTDIVDELWHKFIMQGGIYGMVNERKVSPRWNYKLMGDHHVTRQTIGFSPFDINEWLAKNKPG